MATIFSDDKGKTFYRKARSIFLASLIFCIQAYTHAADLIFQPAQNTYTKGQTFSVSVYVSNNKEAINAVSGVVSFPSDSLSVKSISKEGSIIQLWPEEPSYSDGFVKFEGAILNPGFSAAKGKVVTITFLAKVTGSAQISFKSAQILANDGQATPVLQNIGKGDYSIVNAPVQPKVSSTPSVATTSVATSTATTTIGVVATSTEEASRIPHAVVIKNYTKEEITGNALRVEGQGDSTASVEIVFKDVKSGNSVLYTKSTDGDGNFQYLLQEGLPVGVYQLSVRSVVDGQYGPVSDPSVIIINEKDYLALGLKIINWISLALVTALSLIFALAVIWYAWAWAGRLRRKLQREALVISNPSVSTAAPSPIAVATSTSPAALEEAKALQKDMEMLYAKMAASPQAVKQENIEPVLELDDMQSKLAEIRRRLDAVKANLEKNTA